MKRKIAKYLNTKDSSQYDNLDKIFVMYLNGNIKSLLSKYKEVDIFATLNKKGKSIQLNYSYNNIYVTIDFFENKYSTVIYPTKTSIDEFTNLFVDTLYSNDFNLENLIKEIDEKLKNHPELKDTTAVEKKKSLYNTISWICWCLPIVICGSIALYAFIGEKTIKGNFWWGILLIALPLVVGCIFDIKSKR